MKFKQTVLSFLVVGLTTFTVTSGFAEKRVESLAGDVLSKEAARESVLEALSYASSIMPEDLEVMTETSARLELTGRNLKMYKVYDKYTDNDRVVALDEYNNVVDSDEAIATEKAKRFELFGVANPALYKKAKNAEPSKMLPVMIKMNVEEKFIDKSGLNNPDISAMVQQRISDSQKESQARGLSKFKRLLKKAKIKEFSENSKMRGVLGNGKISVFPGDPKVKRPENKQSGPFIFTELPAGKIAELAKDPSVAFIGSDDDEVVYDYPTITEALPITKTNTVHGYGYKGSGVKIAVLESGLLTQPFSCFNIAARQTTSGSASGHMTNSLGIIGSNYGGSLTGYAPEASILMANGGGYDGPYNWAKNNGVNVITMSWHYTNEETSGSLHARDIYFDYAATHYPYPTIFTSAGNQAGSSAYASGKGYNIIGVANVLLDGDTNRMNDNISTSSSWENPSSAHGDHEVPRLAAPGSRHEVFNTSFGGTSCATPVTASTAAVLMSKNSSLKYWPEAVRAIMMATANYQNADGAVWSKYADGKDGSGMINTYYGYITASQRESTSTPQYRGHDYGSIRASDFTGGVFNKTWTVKTSTTNSKIRVAFTWNSKTASSSSSVLDADLDLKIYNSVGTQVAYSTSWDDNCEFVEFTPSAAGNYTIKIRGYSVPSDFISYYGVAFTTHYDL
ncbi:MAG: S8 family serine peptidase [Candidatus Scalindua sp.]|nr:S8 family serine peptidase [Candidatus Scalindua sp.]